jgi:uncharacterized phage-associated protein
MTTASTLAKYIIARCADRSELITNLKLQKLLYYSQAWHLALHGESLFRDRIEAWVHGPVVPSVFREYREFRWAPLPVDANVDISDKVATHTAKVLKTYGALDAHQLERLTHSEGPWKEARAGLPADASCTRAITLESMRNYYSARLNG